MKLRDLALAASAATIASPARADSFPVARQPLVFVADPKLGVETSVRTFDSLERLFFRYEEALPAIEIDDSETFRGSALRFLGRGLRFVFVDGPLAELSTTVTHEVGGHGGRARELGLEPTYLFYLPTTYRLLFAPHDKTKASAFTTYLTNGIIETPSDIVGTLGGLEAQYAQAWWINARIVRQEGWAHHADYLAYAFAKLEYADSFFSPKTVRRSSSEAEGNDVATYVTGLQEMSNGWRVADRQRIAHRLSASYLWNLADPTLLYSLYGGVVAPLVFGERVMQMPLPHFGDVTVLPSPRFNLTPFGSEQALDVFIEHEGRFLDLYGRVGTSGLARYWGFGGRALGMEVLRRLTLGAELDVWSQPELLIDGPRNVSLDQTPNRFGINSGLYGDVYLFGDLLLTGKLAVKTPGYVMAQPIAAGPHGYVGLSLAWR